jgi:hypothetical protein
MRVNIAYVCSRRMEVRLCDAYLAILRVLQSLGACEVYEGYFPEFDARLVLNHLLGFQVER